MTKIIVICGPTACGKTPVAVNLAKNLDGEIISADSMQIYKYMDIGTAKADAAEMKNIPHHLIDELYPDQPYNVAIFKNRAAVLIEEIANRGKIPIICGGTGFYINALIYDTDFNQQIDNHPAYRAELENIAAEKGAEFLHNMLKDVDFAASQAIDPNNIKRVVRALEYYKLYGRPISDHNQEQKAKQIMAYDAKIFVLHSNREQLYNRINSRVDKMVDAGLVTEVEGLLAKGYSPDLVSMQGIGYKEVVKYLREECSLEEALSIIKQTTRRFAKRQLTWFRHQLSTAEWIDVEAYLNSESIAQEIQNKL